MYSNVQNKSIYLLYTQWAHYINVHAHQASFLQETALGYKIIIIVKRTAAPCSTYTLYIPSECICVTVFVCKQERERERPNACIHTHVPVKRRYTMDSKDRFWIHVNIMMRERASERTRVDFFIFFFLFQLLLLSLLLLFLLPDFGLSLLLLVMVIVFCCCCCCFRRRLLSQFTNVSNSFSLDIGCRTCLYFFSSMKITFLVPNNRQSFHLVWSIDQIDWFVVHWFKFILSVHITREFLVFARLNFVQLDCCKEQRCSIARLL